MNPEAIKAAALAWERGRALQRAGRYREAEPLLRSALKVMPTAVNLLMEYARLAEQLSDWKAAEKMWRRVAQADPARDVSDRIGLALLQLNRNSDALPYLESYARNHPGDCDSIVNLAAAYTRLGNELRAMDILRGALAKRPDLHLAWEALITLLINAGHAEEAGRTIAAARTRFPSSLELRFLEMDHRLKNREYGAGFDLFDTRWTTRFFGGSMQLPKENRWDGQPFAGTLLVRAEQGVGDELIYSSNFADLARKQPGAIVECDLRLQPLFSRSLPELTFISRTLADGDPAKPAWDRDIMAGDLCRFFRRSTADFPVQAGWLKPDTVRADELAADYAQRFGTALRVGISWRSKHPEYGSAKSLQLTDLKPLLEIPGVVFFDIQYGDTQAERDALRAATGIELVRDARIDPLQDIDGLAAQMTTLDLVVSTSNSTVHLAGAMGCPTVVMLHRDRGVPWYWAYEGAEVPWYPATELLRCPQRGEWQPVIAQAANLVRRCTAAAL